MNIVKKIAVILMCIFVTIAPISSINAKAATITDVKQSNPKYGAIKWAIDNDLMHPYKGKFQPSAPVTELQLMKMIAKLDKNYSHSFTSDRIYDYYSGLNIPLYGDSMRAKRNANVARGLFARIYASLNGMDLSEAQAIQYLYMKEITKGTTGKKTYNDFTPRKNITRGDLAVFLYRIAKKGYLNFEGLTSTATGKDNSKITLPIDFLSRGATVQLKAPSGSNKNDSSNYPNVKNEVQNISVSTEELIANGKDSSLITIELKDSYGREIEQDTSLQFKVTSQLGAKFSATKKSSYSDIVETDGGELSVYVTAPSLVESRNDTIKFELINNTDPKFSSYKYKNIEVGLHYVAKPELQISYEVYDPDQQEWIENPDNQGVKMSPLPLLDQGTIRLTDLSAWNKTFSAYLVNPTPTSTKVEDNAVSYEFANLTVANQKISNWLFEQIMYKQLRNYIGAEIEFPTKDSFLNETAIETSFENTTVMEYSNVNGQPNYNYLPPELTDYVYLKYSFNSSSLSAAFYYLIGFIPNNQNQLSMVHYDSVKAIKAIYDSLSGAEKEFLAKNYSKEVAKLNSSNTFVDTLKANEKIAAQPNGMEKYTKIIVSLVAPGGRVITDYKGTVNITYNGISRDVPFTTNTANYTKGTGHAGAAVLYTDSVIEGKSDVTVNLSPSSLDPRYTAIFGELFGKEITETIFVNPKFSENKCTRDIEVAYVVDQSGSMKKNDPNNYASLKTKQLIHQLDAVHNIAVRFNSNAYLEAEGTTEEVLAKTNLFDANNIKGGTNIAKGLNLALDHFIASDSTSKSIILVSDGKTTNKQIDQVIQRASGKVKIYAVAVGEQKNTDLTVLKELADKTGGQFYHISEIEKMHGAYQAIIDAILCQTVVPDNSCLAGDSIYTDANVEISRSNVIMTAILDCGKVEKVRVRFNSKEGEYHFDLVYRGQNVFRAVHNIDRFQNFYLYKEVEFIAYDEDGNILGTKNFKME
ncbi:VWA domain-containing protein [Lysinibacillus yapensis]|uniref:VWA domain-containing protein n=1 Tax=Ureibacillus yapensis TaxID=2304605 RepID=A0A396SAC3_9BACL|nr:VWA domain-containing protein [Lysinibacillus yapensis]RHW33377.1 VWA domain-containing protein [Lysinibacillus yapensis]